MRRRITWRSAAAISVLGLAPGIGAAFAGPAGATTIACAAALGTQCGTFTESAASPTTTMPPAGNSGGLAWAVKGHSSAANTPLIEYPNYSPGTDPGTDLTKVEHYGPVPGSPSARPATWYSIVYTPSGKWTSMCVANPDNKGKGGTDLVLRSCNQSVWQAFMAVAPLPTVGLLAGKLPAAPTSSVVIPNGSSTIAGALYSVANGRFVEVTRPRMSAAVTGPHPGPQPRALSATGRTGERVTSTNSWYWTNATGTR